MEKLRLHQAQQLIEEAGKFESTEKKFKTPVEGTINSNLHGEIMDELLEVEEFIYSSRPSHKLDKEEAKIYIEKILSIRSKIDQILADFGVIEKESPEEEIKKLSEDILILTSKSNFKKIFSKLGVDSQNVLVAGVPLKVDDMKILNPKIPEAALGGIEKKIEHLKNDIQKKIDGNNLRKILVIIEADKASEMFGKRAEEIYNAEIVVLDNLKDLNAEEFINIIK
ncbi:MAG: DUF2100 domain-containing protein [Methanobacterium sp.]